MPPPVFEPLYGSAFATSTGDFRFAFFVGTAGVKYQEVLGSLTFGTALVRTTDQYDPMPPDPMNPAQDYGALLFPATCPAQPQ